MTLLGLAVSLVPRPSVNADLLTEGLGTRLAGGKNELAPFYLASVSHTRSPVSSPFHLRSQYEGCGNLCIDIIYSIAEPVTA